jgi:GDP-mannose transporter
MANVETVIVFRSCTPMAVCMFEYFIYHRALPSRRSCAALLLITAGAICYIATDRDFQLNGVAAYYWAMLWWLVLIFQLTYGKFLVTGIQLKSLWTPVLFTNTLSILPALLLGAVSGEFSHARLSRLTITSTGVFWLLVSCVIGIGISWAGFLCQSLITATAYSVVGVMNKMLTVTVNVLIWDKHASPAGISSLLVCLVGGSLYQQAPARPKPAEEAEAVMLRTAQSDEAEMDQRRGSSKV